MTHETPGERWLRKYTSERDTLIDANAYNPADEKDSCGVGLVAQIDGTPRREIVEMAIRALKAVFHRGAIDADGKVFWNGEAIHRDALAARFAAASSRQPELHLRADRKVAYEKVADVMAAAQRASITKIAFLTESAR